MFRHIEIKWFVGVSTLDELKKLYRNLAKLHHPDVGGNTKDMQEINSEYDYLAGRLPKERPASANASAAEEKPVYESREESEAFRNAVESVINVQGINIELCGSWIWITGNTYPAKDILKANGYKWSKNKQAWYWHEEGYTKIGKKHFTLDEIRSIHGSENLRNGAYTGRMVIA